jgi:hydroxymethylglutaryl-CoA lyase
VALVPNAHGFERALVANVDEVNLVMSASETHNRANMGMECAHSLNGFTDICARRGTSGLKINGTVATAFGCPFEGAQPKERVLAILERYLSMGMDSITLADTTGMADPLQVADLVSDVLLRFSHPQLTLHFHNTRGMGLANALAAYNAGASSFDGAIGGIGGCPFAPGATGNVCTEDLVHMFSRMGVETGVDLGRLIDLSSRLPSLIGHDTPGQVVKAGVSAKRFPLPASFCSKGGS